MDGIAEMYGIDGRRCPRRGISSRGRRGGGGDTGAAVTSATADAAAGAGTDAAARERKRRRGLIGEELCAATSWSSWSGTLSERDGFRRDRLSRRKPPGDVDALRPLRASQAAVPPCHDLLLATRSGVSCAGEKEGAPPVDSSGGEESGDCAGDEVTDAGPVLRWTVPSSTSLTAERTRGLRHIVPVFPRRGTRGGDVQEDQITSSGAARECAFHDGTLYFPT